MSSDADEGEDDVGDENANQGNNGSDEEKTDSDGEESDQEDTIPQEDKAGGKACHEDTDLVEVMATPLNQMWRSKR